MIVLLRCSTQVERHMAPKMLGGQPYSLQTIRVFLLVTSVCMYVWHRIVWSSHIARVRIDRVRLPILLVVSSTGKNEYFPVSVRIWSRETGSAVPSRVSLLISILWWNLVLIYGIPPEFRGGVDLFIQTVIRHRASLEFIGSRNCVPMTFTAESPPAQGQ